MLKRLLLVVIFGATVVVLGYAQQSSLIIPVGKTPANDGKQNFVSYCAPCHGLDGRGRGPVAAALVQAPADLTLLAKSHHGNYPDAHIAAVIEFGAEQHTAHGTKVMPVWGSILGTMDRQGTYKNNQALRVSNITGYVKTLQAK